MDIPLDFDHSALGIQYCTGYVDKLGSWKQGFYCPNGETASSGAFCCGDRSRKYCCNENPFAETEIPARFMSTGNLVAVAMVTFILTAMVTYASIVCCKLVWKKARGPLTLNRRTPNVSCSTSMSINGLMSTMATTDPTLHATAHHTLLPIDAAALLSSSGSTSDIASTVASHSLPSTVSYPSVTTRNVQVESLLASNTSHERCRTTDFIRLMPMTTNNSRPLSSSSSSSMSAQISFLRSQYEPPPPYSSVPYAPIHNASNHSHCSYSSSIATSDRSSTVASTYASDATTSSTGNTTVKTLSTASPSAVVAQFLQAFATPHRKDVVFPQENMPQLKRTLTR